MSRALKPTWIVSNTVLLLAVGDPSLSRGALAQRRVAAAPFAQRLVDDLVEQHHELTGVELAAVTEKGCVTVAATDSLDVGDKCDADEKRPMKTGEPNVEEPSSGDALYDITFALHDAKGTLIGAIGLDIQPAPNQDRAAVLAQARTILHDLEARIPSKKQLLQRSPREPQTKP